MKKKLLSLTLSAVLIGATALNVFAADETNSIGQNKGKADTKWAAQLSADPAVISVAVPAVVPFEIGLKEDTDAGKFDKLVVPNVSATNASTVGVDLYLTNVLDDPGAVQLLPKINLSLNGTLLSAKDYTSESAENGVKLGSMAATNGSLKLAMTGAATAENPVIGSDGDAFTITTTFKVVKKAS